jgi:hypothetical protein
MFRPNYKLITDHIHLSIRGRRNKQGKFDWCEAVVDAGIISGMSFFTGLGALAASNAISMLSLCVLLCASGGEFLSILAAKRRLITEPTQGC